MVRKELVKAEGGGAGDESTNAGFSV